MQYLLGLLSAVCYGANWVLQQDEAAQAPDNLSQHPVGLLVHLLRKPVWLLGLFLLVAGSALQSFALAVGDLEVVEPLLVAGLLFALAFGALLYGREVRRVEWVSGVAVCLALAVLLAVSDPTRTRSGGDIVRWAVASAVTVGGILGLGAAARGRDGVWRAVLYATASGACWGLSDALSKGAFTLAEHHLVALFTAWQSYAFVGASTVALALSQAAFKAAPLRASLPSLAVVEPVVGVALGALVLRSRLRGGPLAVAIDAAAGLILLAGAVVLARSPAVTGDAVS